uniref:Uncharacterized protein n=1 Tax=Tetranychus urticae TaxID=32264 RepID=T1K682_TETUR
MSNVNNRLVNQVQGRFGLRGDTKFGEREEEEGKVEVCENTNFVANEKSNQFVDQPVNQPFKRNQLHNEINNEIDNKVNILSADKKRVSSLIVIIVSVKET